MNSLFCHPMATANNFFKFFSDSVMSLRNLQTLASSRKAIAKSTASTKFSKFPTAASVGNY